MHGKSGDGIATPLVRGRDDPVGGVGIIGDVDEHSENATFPLAHTVPSNGHSATLPDPTPINRSRAYREPQTSPVRHSQNTKPNRDQS
ncbi:hypothetical protein GCM10010172_54220 [Paractinoplanes ferrugineus]|uniref:Uncharacterized protein n=1 Tax=Paractinoplanes ferrugineus TaxID=113564 RepID=A0A919MGL9_9ACTN|nr:hypothetical protein Afe05nite_36000 [Actinoplanes ferrugineus]